MENTANSSLRKIFIEGLQDIYYAEKYLVDALEDLRDDATTSDLKNTFIEHRAATQGQVARLAQVFAAIGEEPDTRKCQAIRGLIKEADEITGDTESDSLTRDAALILAAQKVAHYEIATYGTLAQFANVLGELEAASLLAQTLEEEKKADKTLTALAENFINEQALLEIE